MYKKGFTLIELLVVIAIIGVLSSVVLSSINTARSKGGDVRRISDVKQIGLALELYYNDNNKYPNSSLLGFSMNADSRNPPNVSVPAYSNLMSFLVPTYLPYAPVPPRNNSGEGLMCNNCDEYRYYAMPYGTGYSLCTYLADTKNMTGQSAFGPFYCIYQGCTPPTPATNFSCT